MTTNANARPGAGSGTGVKQVGQTNRSVPPTADAPRPVAGWCPPGGCAARRAAELERAVTFAFESGRRYERAELAEMEATWKPLAAATYEQRVAERIAEMEAAAGRLAVELLDRYGRTPWAYTGGPVDWETGRPLASRIEVAA